jgi:hypothetical protein
LNGKQRQEPLVIIIRLKNGNRGQSCNIAILRRKLVNQGITKLQDRPTLPRDVRDIRAGAAFDFDPPAPCHKLSWVLYARMIAVKSNRKIERLTPDSLEIEELRACPNS